MHNDYSRWRPRSKMASGGHLGIRTPFWRICIHISIWHTQGINSTYEKDHIHEKWQFYPQNYYPLFIFTYFKIIPCLYIHAVFSSPSSRPGLLTTALSNIDFRKHKFVCLVWFGFIIIRKHLGSIHTPKYRLQFYLDMI